MPLKAQKAVDGKETRLTGRPDYTVWYGPHAEIATNMVAIEVKTQNDFGRGETQLLAYMGK